LTRLKISQAEKSGTSMPGPGWKTEVGSFVCPGRKRMSFSLLAPAFESLIFLFHRYGIRGWSMRCAILGQTTNMRRSFVPLQHLLSFSPPTLSLLISKALRSAQRIVVAGARARDAPRSPHTPYSLTCAPFQLT
jgi:hypothetical protein